MLIFELIECEDGVIKQIKMSDGNVFDHILEFEKYCRESPKQMYGEGLHRIVVVANSVGIKMRKWHKKGGVTGKAMLGKTKIAEISDWKMDIKVNEVSMDKLEEIAKLDVTGTFATAPALIVNRDWNLAMGEDEAVKRSIMRPTLLDGYLCATKIGNRGFKPAYSGGLLASAADMHTIYEDVRSFDIASAYPYSALVAKVPMGLSIEVDKERLKKLKVTDGKININSEYGFIGSFIIKGAVRRDWVRMPMLRKNDLPYLRNEVIDHIGVVSADAMLALTPADLEIFHLQYSYDSIEIEAISIHKLGDLPEKAKQFLLDAFDRKNNSPRGSAEREAAKVAINTVIGFWGTDPFYTLGSAKMDKDGEMQGIRSGKTLGHAFNIYNGDENRRGFVSGKVRTWDFRWAAYVVADTRLRLALAEKKCYDAGLNVLYCDTDSIKVSGDQAVTEAIFQELNEEVLSLIDHHGVGLWIDESEGFTRAVFRGVKVYVTENSKGEKDARIAGLGNIEALELIEDMTLEGFANPENEVVVIALRRSPARVEDDEFGAKISYAIAPLMMKY